jgi:hypothetical protein
MSDIIIAAIAFLIGLLIVWNTEVEWMRDDE